jgi:hypothetical protein
MPHAAGGESFLDLVFRIEISAEYARTTRSAMVTIVEPSWNQNCGDKF